MSRHRRKSGAGSVLIGVGTAAAITAFAFFVLPPLLHLSGRSLTPSTADMFLPGG